MSAFEEMLSAAIDRRRVRVFRNGGNLAVRIPQAWGIDTEEVDMIWIGEQIVIQPVKSRSLAELFSELEARPVVELDEPEDAPAEPVHL